MPKVDFTRPVGLHIQIAASKGCWFELAHLSGQGNRRSRGWEFSTRSLCPVPTRLSNAFLGLPSIALFLNPKKLYLRVRPRRTSRSEKQRYFSRLPLSMGHPILSSPLLLRSPLFAVIFTRRRRRRPNTLRVENHRSGGVLPWRR